SEAGWLPSCSSQPPRPRGFEGGFWLDLRSWSGPVLVVSPCKRKRVILQGGVRRERGGGKGQQEEERLPPVLPPCAPSVLPALFLSAILCAFIVIRSILHKNSDSRSLRYECLVR